MRNGMHDVRTGRVQDGQDEKGKGDGKKEGKWRRSGVERRGSALCNILKLDHLVA